MDRIRAASHSNLLHTEMELPEPTSRIGLGAHQMPTKLHRNRDTNQDIAWPNRLDPCNRSNKLPRLLQGLVNQLGLNKLNTNQRMLARHDLQMIVLRCFCENHVGVGHELVIQLQGQTLKLDAVDLAQLLQNSPEDLPSASAFHEIAQQNQRRNAPCLPIELKHPEPLPILEFNNPNFWTKPNFKGPLYAEMKQNIVKVPLSNFDNMQKNYAKQVIELLPPATQGKLRGVPAQLIGVDAYCEVLRDAAHQKQLPPPLMQFRESCEHDNGLKRAIYTNPHIAARILGLPLEAMPSNDETAASIARQIVDSTVPKLQIISNALKFSQRIVYWGQTQSMHLASQVFKKLGEFQGFYNQDMANVPTCFPDIQCPESSAVQLSTNNGRPVYVHANYVSMGYGRQAIAAMQPVHNVKNTPSHLAEFYQLLGNASNTNDTTVLDLRSNTDFENGSHNYCPPLGGKCVIEIPQRKETIQISTLNEQTNSENNCKEITLRIQVGTQAPKNVKVIQFRAWPDHGVVTSDELRALREMVTQPLNQDQRLITHCRAGVGRTGTLLAYEHLHHDLIQHGNGKSMINANGKVNRKKLLQAIGQVVAQGRMERGPYFVQKEDQFKLLYTTLKADLLATSSKAPIGKK